MRSEYNVHSDTAIDAIHKTRITIASGRMINSPRNSGMPRSSKGNRTVNIRHMHYSTRYHAHFESGEPGKGIKSASDKGRDVAVLE